ncbi:MAG TPA: DUF4249 family protein [Bacteroidales bacterium]|nr:DUF4249 family protein [Bacteroidales bacterium]
MKRTSLIEYFILSSFILIFSSCRDLVSDEFQEFTSVPVINGILKTGEHIKIHISFAQKLDANKLEFINNAIVSLYIDGKYEEDLGLSGDGLYVSSIVTQPSKKYSCMVNIPGYPVINCYDSVPEIPDILGIEHIDVAGKNKEGYTYPAIKITFKNDPLNRQYFEIVLRLLHRDYETLASLETITDPVLLNEGLPLLLFSNEYISETTYTMLINYFTGNLSNSGGGGMHTDLFPLIVELRSVSNSYYKFMKQKYLYELGRYPEFMSGTVKALPLYSNVIGGYGIFSGYSVMYDTIYPVN